METIGAEVRTVEMVDWLMGGRITSRKGFELIDFYGHNLF